MNCADVICTIRKKVQYMSKDIIKTEIYVENNKVNVIRINNKEYISLTDLARYANPEEPKI